MKNQTRVHIAINVRDMEEGLKYYNHLLGCSPNRVAEDQYDWIINEPPIHLSIYSSEKYEYGVEHVGFDMTEAKSRKFKERIGTDDIKVFDPDGLKIELYTSEFNQVEPGNENL